MENENIFAGYEPATPSQTIATLPDLSFIKALIVPNAKEGKGRKSYEVPCIVQSNGAIINTVIVMTEAQRACFEGNQYQQINGGALVALVRKA